MRRLKLRHNAASRLIRYRSRSLDKLELIYTDRALRRPKPASRLDTSRDFVMHGINFVFLKSKAIQYRLREIDSLRYRGSNLKDIISLSANEIFSPCNENFITIIIVSKNVSTI